MNLYYINASRYRLIHVSVWPNNENQNSITFVFPVQTSYSYKATCCGMINGGPWTDHYRAVVEYNVNGGSPYIQFFHVDRSSTSTDVTGNSTWYGDGQL